MDRQQEGPKHCPMKFRRGDDWACEEEDCAWWDSVVGECCGILTMAAALAGMARTYASYEEAPGAEEAP